jgi:hypothetical protein
MIVYSSNSEFELCNLLEMSGKWDSGELSEKEIIRAERNTGNVSTKLREIQVSMTLCFTFFVFVTHRHLQIS